VPRIFIILAVALAAACTGSARLGTETVDLRYATGGGEWNSGGGITAVVRVFESDGATIVCGAWTSDNRSIETSDLNEDVIGAASVFAGKTRLVQNLSFMAAAAYSENIAGTQARCIDSMKPWREEFSAAPPRLSFPRMVFFLDEEGGGSVRFREVVRAALIR